MDYCFNNCTVQYCTFSKISCDSDVSIMSLLNTGVIHVITCNLFQLTDNKYTFNTKLSDGVKISTFGAKWRDKAVNHEVHLLDNDLYVY